MRFSRFFIDRPIFAAVLSIVIFIAGAISLFALPVSEYPEVVPPSVVVRAAYPGANPHGHRRNRRRAARGADQRRREHALHVLAGHAPTASLTLTVTFRIGTDVDQAQVQVQNRVSAGAAAPARGGARSRRLHGQELARPHMVVHLTSPDGRYDTLYLRNYATLQRARTRWRASPAWARCACSAPATTPCASGSTRRRWPRAA